MLPQNKNSNQSTKKSNMTNTVFHPIFSTATKDTKSPNRLNRQNRLIFIYKYCSFAIENRPKSFPDKRVYPKKVVFLT